MYSDDLPPAGAVEAYLASVKDKVVQELNGNALPLIYQSGSFWIHPPDAYFGLSNSTKSSGGLAPLPLYQPRVFVWLPHLLDRQSILTCQNHECSYYKDSKHPLTFKAWNDNPVARRVVDIKDNYYILTQRMQCRKSGSGTTGCGKTMNLYDPLILDQLNPGLVAEFPAFLTHRSGIDKTLMTLIRAGIAHRVSSNAWSNILRELHIRDHDIKEMKYLQAVSNAQKIHQKMGNPPKEYEPFSGFKDRNGYCGFAPSQWFINNIYMDYMKHMRPILDQCMAALSGLILKWDHSFKLPKYLMKLDGTQIFSALFTILNHLEQIRYQAFVPTKSLIHIQNGLEEIVTSLKKFGLPEPELGYTDNVAQDIGTFVACIQSLGKNVDSVQLDQFSDLPQLVLPQDVSIHTFGTMTGIQSACLNVLDMIKSDQTIFHIGFDMEWEFSTGLAGLGSQKTALIQIALPKIVYLFQVYSLQKPLPHSLETIIQSQQIVKIGCNIGADFAKLARDFPGLKLPQKQGKLYVGVVELGKLAAQKM